MFKISFDTVVDVARFVETFGADALSLAFKHTDNMEVVRDALRIATNTVITYNSFNDGNNEWEEIINLEDGILENMTFVRYGWGAHCTPLMQYIRQLCEKGHKDIAEEIVVLAVSKASEMNRLGCLVGIKL